MNICACTYMFVLSHVLCVSYLLYVCMYLCMCSVGKIVENLDMVLLFILKCE